MPRMIPPVIDEDTKSNAERKIYHLLRDMPNTDDWCVMHSVGIARHPTQSQGESDFIVLIPDAGVFVLEIKGGGIGYREGKWYSSDRFGEEHAIKNPVQEANDAMHAIRDFIAKHNSERLELNLFGFGVVFPDATVHGRFTCPDVDDLQIADCDDISDMKSYLKRLAGFWRSRKTGNITIPHKQQIDAAVSLLRPSYDFKMSISSQIRSVERQLITLTKNQADTLETLIENERCLVHGSAGTGKTLLAVERARQLAQRGKRVGLFCYNRQLAGWLQKRLEDEPGIICGSLTDYMLKQVQPYMTREQSDMMDKDRKRFYDEELPNAYAEFLIEGKDIPFDCLILDEAQDLLYGKLLDTIDLMIVNGLGSGSWLFFMDAELQNIYHGHVTIGEICESLKSYKAFYVNCTLRENCRNSRSIIQKIDAVFGINTLQRPTESTGAEVKFIRYRRAGDQLDKLEQTAAQLRTEGVEPKDIVCLSASRYERSVVSELQSITVSRDVINRGNELLYSTIYAFKGLESPAVILTDIDSLEYKEQMQLLYVGMTRARSALYVILSDKAFKRIEMSIKGD